MFRGPENGPNDQEKRVPCPDSPRACFVRAFPKSNQNGTQHGLLFPAGDARFSDFLRPRRLIVIILIFQNTHSAAEEHRFGPKMCSAKNKFFVFCPFLFGHGTQRSSKGVHKSARSRPRVSKWPPKGTQRLRKRNTGVKQNSKIVSKAF